MDNCTWRGTTCEFFDNESTQSSINFFNVHKIGNLEKDAKKYIVPKDHLRIFNIDNYIESKTFFRDIVTYFQDIKFDEELQLISYNQEWNISQINYSREVEKFKIIIGNNRISTNQNRTNRQIGNFSLNLLKGLKNQSSKNLILRKLYILLMLSTSTEIQSNQFTFKVEYDETVVSKVCNYADCDTGDIDCLDKIYDWIINEEGSENSFNEKVKVVRSIISRNNRFEISESILDSARSIFQRIINKETEKYFEQVNQLKDDFLTIAERENSIYQSLHFKLLGWFSAVALTIFDKIKDYNGTNIIERVLASSSQKTTLILMMLIMALIIIFLMYCLETRKNQEEFWKLKEFYTGSLMFNNDDFQNKIEFPRINQNYLFGVIVFIFLLLLRLIFTSVYYIIAVMLFGILVTIFYKKGVMEILSSKIDKKDEK
ncbi:Uncharacterised protein [Streptococcus criceti]|uniref:Uncharacterized protein n=1 Tax=Streptococcus criceti HS-6 TaxID=873449 RepID=G5JQ78_STRCG|nr:hypothetical protein [Streptococcus criceti]EHI73604.1 hypothetical protein STRCR_1761 [Streptococcus criceti HS-6]SUN43133.1 Uncharacterised protein [Streptococcus criceti]